MKVAIKAIPADPRDRIKGGGAKYAVREVRDHLQGNRFVLRTDVKSFYVSILNQFPKFVAFRSKHPRRGNYLDRDLGGCELKWVALGTIGYKSARRAFNCTLPVLRCTELLQPNDVKGLGCVQRPNEAIDFESALTSTPDISLHRTIRGSGPETDMAANCSTNADHRRQLSLELSSAV